MKARPLKIGKVLIGGRNPVFILGPCVIESEKFVWRMAKKIAEICAAEDVDLIFKASYDKANRTSVRSFRGVGVREGCEILSAIGQEIENSCNDRCPFARRSRDCRRERSTCCKFQRFFAGRQICCVPPQKPGRAINVKKGQFLAPWDVRNIAEKLIAFGNEKFCFTERGTSFGYNNLVADMRSLYWLRDAGYPRDLRRDAFGATARRGRGFYIGGRRSGAGTGSRGDGRRLRRNFYGGARKSRPRVIGWAKSGFPKGFAEESAHVKGYSCCGVVTAAPSTGAAWFGSYQWRCQF